MQAVFKRSKIKVAPADPNLSETPSKAAGCDPNCTAKRRTPHLACAASKASHYTVFSDNPTHITTQTWTQKPNERLVANVAVGVFRVRDLADLQ